MKLGVSHIRNPQLPLFMTAPLSVGTVLAYVAVLCCGMHVLHTCVVRVFV